MTTTHAPCPYCQSGQEMLKIAYVQRFHKRKRDHGPIDFYECLKCGSGITRPLPSPESLVALYASFADGLPDDMRKARSESPLDGWYRQCRDRISALCGKTSDDAFGWVDVGAGGGELANLIQAAFPRSAGLAVDFHTRPSSLDSRTQWMQADLNEDDIARRVASADVVFSISVIEHVLRPDRFLANLLRMAKPRSLTYVVGPNYASLARRLFGERWPYFLPGEHLNIPSVRGLDSCLRMLAQAERLGQVDIGCNAMAIRYPLRYVLRTLGLNRAAKAIPATLAFPVPTGALEGYLRRK